MAAADISLRPMAGGGLRPGGGAGTNPFAKFGKGASVTPQRAAKAPAVDDKDLVKKRAGESALRYDREFLLLFSQRCESLPPSLDPKSSECIINKDDPDQAGAREALQNALPAPQDDDRNWRTRTALPAENGPPRELNRTQPQTAGDSGASGQPQAAPQPRPTSGGPTGGAPQRQQNGVGGGGATSQLHSAADSGKKAWMPGTTSAEGDASALKSVKGILNKLTPEKFDRLLGQLIDNVKSVDVLNGLIKLIFQNAVEQPTFVEMYAQLCEVLAKELPELAPPKGQTKPMSFQRLLLNTCQDEFEATTEARQALAGQTGYEREAAERKVKQRTIGTIRLIAELYKRGVVKEPVIHVCVVELLGTQGAKPVEDDIEALCEMINVAGKKLEESSKVPAKVEGYMKSLEKLAKSDAIAPRIRFLIRDVLDLRRMKWVPRRTALKAKKLEEIHAEAHAELGMMPALAIASLPPLPGLQQLGPARGAAAETEVELFPGFAGAEDGDWKKLIGNRGGGGSTSALLGDYTPLAQAQPAAAAPTEAASNATPPQTSAAPQYIKGLTEEERERRADGLFTEYLSAADDKEAILSAHELAAPGFLPTLVQRGVLKLVDCMQPREHEVLSALLVRLTSKQAYSVDDLKAGLAKVTETMDDLMMDAPLAPKLVGGVIGRALLEGVLPPPALPELLKPIEGGEARRAVAAAALHFIKDTGGEDKLKESTAGLKGGDFLEPDPELDPPDLPSTADWLNSEGLTALAA